VGFLPDTRVPMCSMTKPYTATLVLALVESGRLELDAPVRRYLPDFRVADADASARVTVRHLLHHTAGWVGEVEGQDSPHPSDGLDRGDGAVAAQVARMAGYRQITPPGRQWSYCNSAYVVAGRLAEVACGDSFENLVARSILQPLAMSHSTLFPEIAIVHPLAVGHAVGPDGFEVVRWPWVPERRLAPAGGLISTVVDQLRSLRWWLGDEQDGVERGPLSAATRQRMVRETVPAGSGCDAMGLGWMLDDLDGALVAHHGGTGWGIQTLSLFVPDADVALVVLANGRGGMRLASAVREYVLGSCAGLRDPARAPIEVAPERLAEYAGAYRRLGVDRDELLEVRVSGAGLTLLVPGDGGADPPAAIEARLFRTDELIMSDGPLAGLRAEFLRDGDAGLGALRFAGRVWLREPEGAGSDVRG
jgi:CubicO group peptidase (beta-lactamase class C family)